MIRRSVRLLVIPSNSSQPHTYYEDIYLISDPSGKLLIENSSSTISLDMSSDMPDGASESTQPVSGLSSSFHRSEVAKTTPVPLPEHQPKKESSSNSLRQSRRLSLQVSNDLHRQLKIIALEDEETMNSLIVGVLRNYLQGRHDAFNRLQRSSRR